MWLLKVLFKVILALEWSRYISLYCHHTSIINGRHKLAWITTISHYLTVYMCTFVKHDWVLTLISLLLLQQGLLQ